MGAGRGLRRRGAALGLAVAFAWLFVGWSAWRAREFRRQRRALESARAEMQAGRYGHASRTLQALAAGGPVSDEAAYWLGESEAARGRAWEAADAWARVPPGSPFATRALQRLTQMEIDRGRLAAAERIVEAALTDPRIDVGGLRMLLGMIYSLQGRVDDGLRLVEENWRRLDEAGRGASEKAIQLARLHASLRREAASTGPMRAYLDRASRLSPDDDRVWLGRAMLATRTGGCAEAARRLDACRERRPDDPAVWRARLDWAVACGRVDEARTAMAHLPASGSDEAQVERLAAWLAARRGDEEAERRALERLIEADPADLVALDRLAAVARDRADELGRRKAEVERLEARSRELDRRNQPIRDADELARIAGQLGRSFEARAFLTVAVAADPDRVELRESLERLNRARRPAPPDPGRTLAQALAHELAPGVR